MRFYKDFKIVYNKNNDKFLIKGKSKYLFFNVWYSLDKYFEPVYFSDYSDIEYYPTKSMAMKRIIGYIKEQDERIAKEKENKDLVISSDEIKDKFPEYFI